MAEHKRRQRVRSVRNFGIIVVVIVAAIVFLAWRSGSDKTPVTAASNSSSASVSQAVLSSARSSASQSVSVNG